MSSLWQRNCAMHLMMELAHRNCYCVIDTLFLEFWRDIDVSRLEEFTSVSSENLSLFLSDIFDAWDCLLHWRMDEVIPFAYGPYHWVILITWFWLNFMLKLFKCWLFGWVQMLSLHVIIWLERRWYCCHELLEQLNGLVYGLSWMVFILKCFTYPFFRPQKSHSEKFKFVFRKAKADVNLIDATLCHTVQHFLQVPFQSRTQDDVRLPKALGPWQYFSNPKCHKT